MWKLGSRMPTRILLIWASIASATALWVSVGWSGALEARTSAAFDNGTARGGYQLRCWQYGKLLFEENHVEFVDAKAKSGLELRRTQADHGQLYVLDTSNATCLMKAEAANDSPLGKPGNQ